MKKLVQGKTRMETVFHGKNTMKKGFQGKTRMKKVVHG